MTAWVQCRECGRHVKWTPTGWRHVKASLQSWFEPHPVSPEVVEVDDE